MNIIFEDEDLALLYEGNTLKGKYQPSLVKQFIKTIVQIQSLNKLADFKKFNSLNFEALSGDKNNLYSVRVNKQYRLEFSMDLDSNNIIIITIHLLRLSNHYK